LAVAGGFNASLSVARLADQALRFAQSEQRPAALAILASSE
jgi:hypothetical protein